MIKSKHQWMKIRMDNDNEDNDDKEYKDDDDGHLVVMMITMLISSDLFLLFKVFPANFLKKHTILNFLELKTSKI